MSLFAGLFKHSKKSKEAPNPLFDDANKFKFKSKTTTTSLPSSTLKTEKRKKKQDENPPATNNNPSTKKLRQVTKEKLTQPSKTTSTSNPKVNSNLKSKPSPPPSSSTTTTKKEDASKLRRTIFVGNLPQNITRKQITSLFSQFGSIDSVRLRSLPLDPKVKMPRKAACVSSNIDTNRGSAHAYVVFTNDNDGVVADALHLNMTEYEGRHIRVDRAAAPSKKKEETKDQEKKKREKGDDDDDASEDEEEEDNNILPSSSSVVEYDPTRSLFIGNLPLDAEDEDVIRFFTHGRMSEELGGQLEACRVVRDAKTSVGKGIAFVMFKNRAAAKAGMQLAGQKLKNRAVRIDRVKAGLSSGGGGKGKQAWEGMRATSKGGVKKGGSGVGGSVGGSGVKVGGKRKSDGKRPAVAARKEKQRSAARKAK